MFIYKSSPIIYNLSDMRWRVLGDQLTGIIFSLEYPQYSDRDLNDVI